MELSAFCMWNQFWCICFYLCFR